MKLETSGAVVFASGVVDIGIRMQWRLKKSDARYVHRNPEFRRSSVPTCDPKDEVRSVCVGAVKVQTVAGLKIDRSYDSYKTQKENISFRELGWMYTVPDLILTTATEHVRAVSK